MNVTPISSGEYSDYRVSHLADSKETADAIVAVLNSDSDDCYSDYRVEDRTMLVRTCAPVAVEELYLSATVPTTVSPYEFSEHEYTRTVFVWAGDEYLPCTVSVHAGNRNVNLTVVGTDTERVRKVFSERKARLIAEIDITYARLLEEQAA